jgi:hypothetical protein
MKGSRTKSCQFHTASADMRMAKSNKCLIDMTSARVSMRSRNPAMIASFKGHHDGRRSTIPKRNL